MMRPPEPDDVDPLDILDVTEDFMQDLVEKRRNAIDIQASAAIRAILAGEPPRDIAHRCGFKDPSRSEPQTPDQVVRQMMGFAEQPSQAAVINFGQWLTHWLYHQIIEAAEDCDGA